MDSSDNGFICLHRKLLKWEWWDDINTFRVFVTLLLMASHRDHRYKGMVILKGQVLTSSVQLSKKTHLGRQQVRTALAKLEKTQEINLQTNQKFTIITVCNWDTYQNQFQQPNQQLNQQVTNSQPTGNQLITTINKGEEGIIREKKDISSSRDDSFHCPYLKIVELFHEMTSFPRLRGELSEQRKRAIRSRWRASACDLKVFTEVFGKAAQSDFLNARNQQKWTGCNFDWIIKPGNWQKILEGVYENKRSLGGTTDDQHRRGF